MSVLTPARPQSSTVSCPLPAVAPAPTVAAIAVAVVADLVRRTCLSVGSVTRELLSWQGAFFEGAFPGTVPHRLLRRDPSYGQLDQVVMVGTLRPLVVTTGRHRGGGCPARSLPAVPPRS